MSDQTDNFQQLLIPYGLSTEEASLYIYLRKNGYASALQISRDIRMGRTKVYRVLDKLIEKQLIEQKLHDMGLRFGATDPSKLEQLVVEKEHSVASLRESLPTLVEKLTMLNREKNEKSKILFYKGVEGLKQITFNSTKADGMLRIIERVNDMSAFLPRDFSEDIRKRFLENNIACRQLHSHKTLDPWTEVSGFVKLSESRYIPKEKLNVDFETLVYNDVYVMYNTKGENDDMFCVEIYNPELASLQKQIFDFMWESATKMRFTDEHGSAVLEEDLMKD